MKIPAFFVEYDTVSQYPGIGGSLLLTPEIVQCILTFKRRDWDESGAFYYRFVRT
jgi:hypothetical protein